MEAQAERAENQRRMIERSLWVEEDRKNGAGEPQVVLCEQLAIEVRDWSKKWLVERDSSLFSNDPAVKVMGPIDWLSEKTGIHVRRLGGISNNEFDTVSLSQAEKILIAIDRDYMLSNGEIHVIPNPNWSLEKWTDHMRQAGCI
jgi:hypothetical protein